MLFPELPAHPPTLKLFTSPEVSILLALSQISLSVWSVAAVCFSVWAAVVSAVTEITISGSWLSQVQKKILQPPAPPFANPHSPDQPHFYSLVWIEEQK